MRHDLTTFPSTRAAAIADLLSSLEVVLISCQVLPDADRESAWHADADRITGEVARHLATARARLSPSYKPSTASAH
jgi:hypothetical protein